MSLLPYFCRRRFFWAVALLAAAAVGAAGLLAGWGTVSPERAVYDRIAVGISSEQVGAMLGDWSPGMTIGSLYSYRTVWRAPNGARIILTFDSDDKVTRKEFEEGDRSLTGRLKRLAGRLRMR
jgi:hypothetical protein